MTKVNPAAQPGKLTLKLDLNKVNVSVCSPINPTGGMWEVHQFILGLYLQTTKTNFFKFTLWSLCSK